MSQCLSSVVLGLSDGFLPYAPPVFERCVNIVKQCLLKFQAFLSDRTNETEEPDRTHLIVALDLLSGLTQALGSDIVPFFTNSNPPLLSLMIACFNVSVTLSGWLKTDVVPAVPRTAS